MYASTIGGGAITAVVFKGQKQQPVAKPAGAAHAAPAVKSEASGKKAA